MKRSSGTDHQDENANQGRVQPSRVTRPRIFRLGLVALLMTFALGNQSCPPPEANETLACSGRRLIVESGTCTVIENPCADHVVAVREMHKG